LGGDGRAPNGRFLGNRASPKTNRKPRPSRRRGAGGGGAPAPRISLSTGTGPSFSVFFAISRKQVRPAASGGQPHRERMERSIRCWLGVRGQGRGGPLGKGHPGALGRFGFDEKYRAQTGGNIFASGMGAGGLYGGFLLRREGKCSAGALGGGKADSSPGEKKNRRGGGGGGGPAFHSEFQWREKGPIPRQCDARIDGCRGCRCSGETDPPGGGPLCRQAGGISNWNVFKPVMICFKLLPLLRS